MANRNKGVRFKTYKNIVEMIVDDNIKLFEDKYINMSITGTKKFVTREFSTRYYYSIYKYGFQSLGFRNPQLIVRKSSQYFNSIFIQEPSEFGSRVVNEKGDLVLNDKQFISFIIFKESGFDEDVIFSIVNKYK